jgi:hypothetical protein
MMLNHGTAVTIRFDPFLAIVSWFTGGILLGLIEVPPPEYGVKTNSQAHSDFWETPVTNIGFTSLLLGFVLGLAQYWSSVVFPGFTLLIARAFLLQIGIITKRRSVLSP